MVRGAVERRREFPAATWAGDKLDDAADGGLDFPSAGDAIGVLEEGPGLLQVGHA